MMIFTGTFLTLAEAAVWQTTEDKFPFPLGMLKVIHNHSNYIYTIFKTLNLGAICENVCGVLLLTHTCVSKSSSNSVVVYL